MNEVQLNENKLIAEFMGLTYFPNAKYKNDLYEMGDMQGNWEETDIYVLNPTKEFKEKLIFGGFADEDHYGDKKPYDNYYWGVKYDTSWDWLMPVVDKIHSPMKVKLYGVYRDIGGEENSVIIHRAVQNKRYIVLKIEYGRRFVEFIEYQKEGESMLEPTYRFTLQFIKWYNKHK